MTGTLPFMMLSYRVLLMLALLLLLLLLLLLRSSTTPELEPTFADVQNGETRRSQTFGSKNIYRKSNSNEVRLSADDPSGLSEGAR
jgi:hypothetical protein